MEPTSIECASHDQPSPWVVRFAPLIPQGEVLDLACGTGRHARFLTTRGNRIVAVDRDADALERAAGSGIITMQIDLESSDASDASWPFAAERFAAVVVTNYLHRPLFPRMLESVAQQGVLIYETFAQGNERFGKPSNPAFLLAAGELPDRLREDARNAWHVVAFEDGCVDLPKPARVQRICAVKGDVAPSMLRLV
jgi:SAM-dependent methyltransferase